ncbi:hypothetical protein [Mangrovicoccus ximenensis]|uniref:hypothetical protein n=1 Tax=Mangrovicoccus ximenensis TaxID=1911570 RepID=UPI000D3D8FFC|nr:hypothetical protein [Mangrovicoccus ximenensis]
MLERFEEMAAGIEARPHLLRLGALFSETVLVEVGGDEYYLAFDRGHLVSVTGGPSKKTPWRFALVTDREALETFWQPLPPPGFHDIFAMAKIGRMKMLGDMLALVKSLRFVKEVLAIPRAAREETAA